MIRLPNFILLIVLISILACQSDSAVPQGLSSPVRIEIDIRDTTSYFVPKTHHFIKLESNESSLIENIRFVKKENDRIWILDDKRSAILTFDHEGKFLFRIESLGKGPGEYLYLDDFDVYEDKIYLLSGYQRKLLIFNEDGNFISERSIPEEGDFKAIEVINPNKFIMTGGNHKEAGYDLIYITDSTFTTLNSGVPANEYGVQTALKSNGVSTAVDGKTYYFTYGAGPIYAIDLVSNEISPAFVPDFGKLTFTENEVQNRTGMEVGQLYFESKKVRNNLFYELDDSYVMHCYFYPFQPRSSIVVINKQNQHEIQHNSLGLLVNDFLFQVEKPFSKIDHEFLVYPVESTDATLADLASYKQGLPFGKSNNIQDFTQSPSDNPTLLFFSP
ncbi:6-bladed beta-propeller [Flavilitoribacter nigricans]|uniref:6-bladed beta-propeller n=1 Tax=Flavilitoribacter nigricans (strain ATCC 23147 / DSM 23189 / NBRC 102662 / NCIMB 1420 / SS-2) TaxID=1122177 RepID=A0A2D0N0P1_FLAN2|nr:6-bladed beta-propeller [Flavilitoribacter nigricans]PHN01283.1 hypothetical protein CRP01_38035 [Flavilitoribacter nigricans DSM 23189 = NBRC 102662]